MHHRARGQAVIEFAFVALLFLTLLFAIFDFGILLNDWISVSSAASVGGRQAAVGACMEGPTDSFTCAAGETSVVGAIMQSAPLMATGGNCQSSPLPVDARNVCVSRVDIGVVDLSVPGAAYCQDVELWASSQTVGSPSTSTVIRTSGTTWGSDTLVGRRVSFSSGANATAASTIAGNSGTTITVDPPFANAPSVGDAFNITTLTVAPIASGWLPGCSNTMPTPVISDALSVLVRAHVELPVSVPGMATDIFAESSSTVRFEGAYVS